MTTKVLLAQGSGQVAMAAMMAATSAESAVVVTAPASMGKTSALTRFVMDGETFQMDDGELIDPDRVMISTDQTTYMVASPEESERRLEEMLNPTPSTDFDGLPNRLSIDRSSPHHTSCGAYVGVKIDGVEAPNCIEFCVSEGWVRLGNPANARVSQREIETAPKQYGKVEVWWKAKPSRQVRRQMARLAR